MNQNNRMLMETIKRYFFPYPPHRITESGNEHLKESLKNSGFWSMPDFTDNRGVWDKHADNNVRKKNREWLKLHAIIFSKRWGILSILSLFFGWIFSGFLWLEVPLLLLCYISGAIAMVFYHIHRVLNKIDIKIIYKIMIIIAYIGIGFII